MYAKRCAELLRDTEAERDALQGQFERACEAFGIVAGSLHKDHQERMDALTKALAHAGIALTDDGAQTGEGGDDGG